MPVEPDPSIPGLLDLLIERPIADPVGLPVAEPSPAPPRRPVIEPPRLRRAVADARDWVELEA